MRIILHAGLHKSGTTSIQEAWLREYADHPAAWYPAPPPGPPGHHRLFRPLLRAFTDGLAPDLAGAAVAFHARGGARQTLEELLAEARRQRIAMLLLSSENLDRAREEDRVRLQEAFGDQDVTLVFTATRPVHRWCSGWQTLVKHGLAEYPNDAQRHVSAFAALEPGRLAELVDLLPNSRAIVRLVRSAPPEPDLAAGLARTLGVPHTDRAARPVLNPSLGTDTEVVLRINRADMALGTDRSGRALLERLRGRGFIYRDAPELAERYVVPAEVLEAAEAERAWLAGLEVDENTHIRLVDPHGQLPAWTDPTMPEWYRTISRQEAVLPELDVRAEDRETQLWRARQERSAFRKQAQRVEEKPAR